MLTGLEQNAFAPTSVGLHRQALGGKLSGLGCKTLLYEFTLALFDFLFLCCCGITVENYEYWL